MKRDMDLVRNLLLGIEERDRGDGNWTSFGDLTLPEGTETPEPMVQEHLRLLLEAGLIEAMVDNTWSSRAVRPIRLTWAGHDFLAAIRDEGVWSSTKEAVGKVGGTAALETWRAAATALTTAAVTAGLAAVRGGA